MVAIHKLITQSGQTIIEALVALGVAVFIISAITISAITSIGNSDFSKNQNLATQYSQQGMEILRQQGMSNWTAFSLYNGTYCLDENTTTLTAPGANGCTKNVANFFVREAKVAPGDSSCGGVASKVSVIVAWADSRCTSESNIYCHNVTLDSCIANLNTAGSP